MKTLAEKIAVMQAAERGEMIQIWDGGDWVDCPDPTWDWRRCDYRIKPTPKRLPLGPEDVPPGSVVRRCGDPEWLWRGICPDSVNGILVRSTASHVSFKELMDNYIISRDGGKTWEPCWKEVE
jgi:hypothetical protein